MVFAPCRGQPVPGGVRPGGVHDDSIALVPMPRQYGISTNADMSFLFILSNTPGPFLSVSAGGVPCQP